MTRKELMRMMPANGDDLPAATRIVELGYPTIAPVMRVMVRWMGVAKSSVADAFAAFFAQLGAPGVEVIAEGLTRDNCWLRHRIFCRILPEWPPEVVRQLSNNLTMVATQPDAYDNDLRSMAVLTAHRLVDLEWIREWVSFKKERMAERNQLLMKLEEQLKHIQGPTAEDSSPT